MHIEGEQHFEATPDEVYEALTDPDELGRAFSAIERVDADGPEWTVVVRPPIPGGFRIKFSVHFEELRENEHARLHAWGKSLGGRISVDSSFDLAPQGSGTLMHWTAEIDAAGIFSGLGSQALAPVAKQQADRALGRLARATLAQLADFDMTVGDAGVRPALRRLDQSARKLLTTAPLLG